MLPPPADCPNTSSCEGSPPLPQSSSARSRQKAVQALANSMSVAQHSQCLHIVVRPPQCHLLIKKCTIDVATSDQRLGA